MRHLVTGGSGFLGNLIVRHFLAEGDEVISLDVWEDAQRPRAAQFVKGDVLNRDLVRSLMASVDIVHHTAALVPLSKSGSRFRRVNVDGTKVVAEEARAANVRGFIHMSSSAIFGAPACPASNSSPLAPLEVYGRSKLEGELAVREITAGSNMTVVVVRPRTIIGVERLGIFQVLFDWIKDGSNIYVIGDGNNKIQFLHANDLVDAYMLVYRSGKSGAYNIGTDRFDTIGSALRNLCRHAGSRSRVVGLPAALTVGCLQSLDKLGLSPLAPWHYLTYGKDFYFDLTPLLELGWKPQYSNDRMLAESYDSFVQNYQQLLSNTLNSPHRKRVKERALKILKAISKW